MGQSIIRTSGHIVTPLLHRHTHVFLCWHYFNTDFLHTTSPKIGEKE